jgi:hypothetical protein
MIHCGSVTGSVTGSFQSGVLNRAAVTHSGGCATGWGFEPGGHTGLVECDAEGSGVTLDLGGSGGGRFARSVGEQ